MPLIRIEFDEAKVQKKEIESLALAVQKIISETTKIEDVFVYGNSSQIRVGVAPIEIFIEISANKVKDSESLMKELKSKLIEWKKGNSFLHPINLTLIPMQWKFEVGI